MAEGITPGSARPAGASSAPANVAGRAQPASSAPTAAPGDAYTPRSGSDLQTLAALVRQLQERITGLEARVADLAGTDDFAPVPLGHLSQAGNRVWQGAVTPPSPQPAAVASPAPAAARPPLPPNPPAADRPKAGNGGSKTYTVRPGDTLWSIAGRELGDPTRFQEIVAANRDTHPGLGASPDFISPGWVLELPPARALSRPKAGGRKPKPAQPSSRPRPDGDHGSSVGSTRSPDRPAGQQAPAASPQQGPPGATPAPVAVDAEVLPPALPVAPPRRPNLPPVTVQPPALSPIPGVDPGRGFLIERQETHVEAVETETDTRWEVGADGQARPARQATEVTAAETVTRTRWRVSGSSPATPPSAPPPGGQPVAGEPATKPDQALISRRREELEAYLKAHRNAGAIVALVKDHPEYLEAATVEQKARLVRQALGTLFTDKDDRSAALAVMKAAGKQGDLTAVLAQLRDKKKLQGALRDLGGTGEGLALAKLLLAQGLYEEPWLVGALSGPGVSDLLRALGWKHPMIGTSDALRALPEASRRAMMATLVAGDFTQQDHRQATWINQHMAQPITLPDYDPNRMR